MMAQDNQSSRSALVTSLIVLVLPFAFSLLAASLHPPFLYDALRYGLFQLCLGILPSYALGRFFFREQGLGLLEAIGLGYPVLLCLFFSLFWGGALLRVPLLPLALLPLAAWGLWDAFMRARSRLLTPAPLWAVQGAVFALCVAVTFGFFLTMVPPAPGGEFFFYKDYSLAIGKTWTMARFMDGQALMDFRLLDVPLAYHLMQFCQQAFAYKVAGAAPYAVSFFLEPVFTWFYLILALFAGARRLAGLTTGQTLWIALAVLFCPSRDYHGWQNYQLFGAPLTYPFGFSSFLLFVFYCWGVLTDRLKPLNPLYFGLLFMAAAGTKSVLGVMLPLALVPVFLLRAARRQTTWRDWLVIPLFVLSVLWLKATMYSYTEQAVLKDKGIAGSLMDATEWALYLLRSPEPIFFLLLAATDRIFRVRLFAHRQFLVFAATFLCICVGLPAAVLFAGGFEYFLWYGRILLLVLFALAAAYVFEKRKKAHMLAACLVALYGLTAFWGMNIHDRLKERAGLPRVTPQSIHPSTTLDRDEWEGLNWAAANLPHGSLALTNRMTCVYRYIRPSGVQLVEEPFYDYLALSGLQGYSMPTGWLPGPIKTLRDERLATVRAFVDGADPEVQAQVLRRVGFQYFLQCLRFDNKSYAAVPGLTPVYANRSLIVYKVGQGPLGPAEEKP